MKSVDTRSHFNVYKTSIQRRRRHRIEVLQMLKRRRVSIGSIHEFFVNKLEFIKLRYRDIGNLFYKYYHSSKKEQEELTKIAMFKCSMENLELIK